MGTKIEWCDEVWNPITGCTPISEGCQNCYAAKMAQRLKGRFGYDKNNPFKITLHEDKLNKNFKGNGQLIFVNSMGDLFHDRVKRMFIGFVVDVVKKNPQHIFIVLTKRPENALLGHTAGFMEFPDNLWLGVTAENQQRANERIPILLQIPAKVRFVSVEPMLGSVDLSKYLNCYSESYKKIDWVICGAETGQKKRYMKIEWASDLMKQCEQLGTPFFFKKDSNNCTRIFGKEYKQFPKEK